MKTEDIIKHRRTYFAAANGFSGFRSYFNTVFTRDKFERVYVLKGGPGTGKSTLMKKLLAHFAELGCECEIILCSSDPNSLDGVIVVKGDKRIAILDGTAPHETDAKMPLATDKIINLADAVYDARVREFRNEIICINKRKAMHYSNAYGLLSLAGKVYDSINALRKNTCTELYEDIYKKILSKIVAIKQGRKEKLPLISSFSKRGFTRILPINFNQNDVLYLKGDLSSIAVFFEDISQKLDRSGVKYAVIPSPLSDGICDGILISDTTLLLGGLGSENDASGYEVISLPEIKEESISLYSYYTKLFSELLSKAQSELGLASWAHFELEDIYTNNIDFGVLDKICECLRAEIATILLKS